MVRGLREFALAHPHWTLRYFGKKPTDPGWRYWGPPAVIVSSEANSFVRREWSPHAPTVALMDMPCANIIIERDDAAIGRLMAEHLMDLGFRRLAFVSTRQGAYSNRRELAFVQAAKERGIAVVPMPLVIDFNKPATFKTWEPDHPLTVWLQTLEKPCGIGCATDGLGDMVIGACHFCNIHVPEDLAVVGVDNDESVCTLTDPPLTSVAIPWRRVGYEAGRWVERLLEEHPPPSGKKVLLPPNDVVLRGSSDVLATPDAALRRAVSFIRQHACEGITVKEVAAAVSIDRRRLERTFRAHLKRTPHDEMRRIQIETAKRLLAETDIPIREVCRMVGMSEDYFYANFRRATGSSPNTFRVAHRRR